MIGNGYVLIIFDSVIVPPYVLAMEWQGQGSLCMQLSPLNNHEEGIEKCSRNMFFVYGVVRPLRQF